jgi:Membrane domain of glycerophosphoryl diester phosphodiesterase
MTPNLRPLGLGELLDRAISIYRKNFITLVGIVAIVSVPLLLLQVVAALFALPADPFLLARLGASRSPSTPILPLLIFYAASLLVLLLQAIAGIFQSGALVIAVSEAYHGGASSIKQAYGETLRRWASLLLGLVIVGAANLAVYVLLFVPIFALLLAGPVFGSNSPFVGAAAIGLSGLVCLGFIPAILLLILINVRWIFREQTILLEQLNAVNGLRRSWNLISGSFFRVLFIGVVLFIFVYVLAAVPTGAAQFSLMIFLPGSLVLTTVLNSVITTLVELLVAPIQVAVLTLLYYDLRVRREGYDLELKARELERLPALTAPQPGL